MPEVCTQIDRGAASQAQARMICRHGLRGQQCLRVRSRAAPAATVARLLEAPGLHSSPARGQRSTLTKDIAVKDRPVPTCTAMNQLNTRGIEALTTV
jgi:hypothetical protein